MTVRSRLAFVIDNSLLLIVGSVAALIWANAEPISYRRFATGAQFLVNDIAMVFFFAMAAKEIVEATLPGGALASRREAAVPLLAAAGGMAVPAALYASAAAVLGYPELLRGWAIPCATDIAFSYLTARFVFPARHPAIPFLLLLAVADDALGLILLAAFYPSHPVLPGLFVVLMLPSLAAAWGLKALSVRNFWPYVGAAGALSWAALYFGGLHPALALVPIVPFMPREKRYHELFEDREPQKVDTLNRFAEWWHVPTQVILFFFGLVNAGVGLTSVGPATWLVMLSLLIGKPAGIFITTALAVAGGLRKPPRMSYVEVFVVGITAGIGFTVALFFATAAFPPGNVLDHAKMGALLSFCAAPIAIAVGRMAGLRPGRRTKHTPRAST
jgi:NhaA family Na+:H+ antiporter